MRRRVAGGLAGRSQADDPDVVVDLHGDGDRPAGLHDLVLVAVGAVDHRRAGHGPAGGQAPLGGVSALGIAAILDRLGLLGADRGALWPIGQAPVGGIDDPGGAGLAVDARELAAHVPELRLRLTSADVVDVGRGELMRPTFLIGPRLRVGDRQRLEGVRPLQLGERGAGPKPAQVRMPLRVPRRTIRPRLRGAQCKNGDREAQIEGCAHGPTLCEPLGASRPRRRGHWTRPRSKSSHDPGEQPPIAPRAS